MIFTLATMALALSAVKADIRHLESTNCTGYNACFNMTDDVSFGCNGDSACSQKQGDVLGSSDFLSCSGYSSCDEMNGKVSFGCSGTNACSSKQGDVQGSSDSPSCTGENSCGVMDGEVSFGCNGTNACIYKQGDVRGTADNPSCTGESSCFLSTGIINEGACTSPWSCAGAVEDVPEGCCTQPCACANCTNLIFEIDRTSCISFCGSGTSNLVSCSSGNTPEDGVANKTDDLDNDANTLEFVGNGTSKYNATTNTLTVQLERGSFYSNFTPNVTLWAINTSVPLVETVCGVGNSTAAADNVELSGGLTSVSSKPNSEVFSQDILMNLTDMEKSNIYFNTSATEGAIKFCIRADYKLDDMSVGFAESLVDLAVNMTVGFEVSPVGMERDAPISQEVEADYEVEACICNATNGCIDNPVISQNSEMRVCLFSPSDGLMIGIVRQLDVIQGGVTQFSPVNDSNPSKLATVEPFEDYNLVVITRAITKLFNYANPPDITVVGRVLLQFLPNGRRVLEENENVFADGTETDVEKSASGAFELKVRLKPITDLEEFVEDDKEKKDIVVVEGQEKEDVDAPGESAGTSVPINMIVGVVEAVAFIMMLAVAF